MAGTKAGGLKAAATNKQRYGEDFYKVNGAKGGRAGHTGGFASNPELARRVGRTGGLHSRKGWIAIERTDTYILWRKRTTGETDIQIL